MLAKGIPLRGGLDIGIALENDDGQVYGRALSKAYDLENKVARSIRIVLGQELLDFLSNAASDSGHPYSEDAKFCLRFTKQDTDSCYILDYLAEPLHQPTDFINLTSKAKAFLESQKYRFRNSGDHELESKYEKALNYFIESGI